MDKGAFQRWGITADDFDTAIAQNATDEAILAWLESRVREGGREAANRWLTEEKKANLDRQDAEEGAIAA